MAGTDADVQDLLGRTEKSPQIIRRANASTTVRSYYVSGGAVYPGRYRWVDVLETDDDATRAAAIAAKLLE
jgi:hypothetical protein